MDGTGLAALLPNVVTQVQLHQLEDDVQLTPRHHHIQHPPSPAPSSSPAKSQRLYCIMLGWRRDWRMDISRCVVVGTPSVCLQIKSSGVHCQMKKSTRDAHMSMGTFLRATGAPVRRSAAL